MELSISSPKETRLLVRDQAELLDWLAIVESCWDLGALQGLE